MSEPIRYSEVSNDWNGEAAGLAPSADGEWVKYEDYARLKADFYQASDERADYAKDVAKLKAEVERLRKATEWQPIETAPKDGSTILAYRVPHGAFIIQRYYGNDSYQMTHWMPLPKPPKEGKPSA